MADKKTGAKKTDANKPDLPPMLKAVPNSYQPILQDVPLSKKDIEDRREKVVEITATITKHEAEKKRVTSEISGKIKTEKAELDKLMNELSDGKVTVDRKCELWYDTVNRQRVWKDTESGAELKREDMTERDRQLDLSSLVEHQ